ncbi:hypothetical protein [Sphaerisporangium sp. TRM90804]|uniref:hypothetical protein n=1 Tax=Sphaerisporangium sp. TRM90804 TaxID=3031113 RepID=UPI002448EB77|nr:hypothetical protein [Sphaerisporangium sp. TRM90804]MDH2429848.1 hypothetical protein [Sphaerisporangium sp. TRM90804]
MASGPHDPRSSWWSADDADHGSTSRRSGSHPAQTSPPTLHHFPPGPSGEGSRGLPLDSPWALPPFGAPTENDGSPGAEDPAEPPRPTVGRHPYARPAGGPPAEPRHSAGRTPPDHDEDPAPGEWTADPSADWRFQGTPAWGSESSPEWRSPGSPDDWDPRAAPEPEWDPRAAAEPVWEEPPAWGARQAGRSEPPAESTDPSPPPRRLVDRPDKLVASGPPRTPAPPAGDSGIRVHPRIPAEPEAAHGRRPGAGLATSGPPGHPSPRDPAGPAPGRDGGEYGDEYDEYDDGRPPGDHDPHEGAPPARPDILVASGPARPRGGGRGRHHRDQAAARAQRRPARPRPVPPRRPAAPPRRASPRGLLTPVVVIVALLAAAGLGLAIVNWVNSPVSSGLRLAAGDGGSGDRAFVAPPGISGNGSSQVLNAVTSVGSTVVAVGSDTTSPVPRPLFLVSTDAGRSWELGRVAVPAGYQPAGSAGRVTGGGGRWLAAGTEAPGTAGPAARGMWTSTDGRSWTAVDPARLTAFWSGDRITDLARTASGFVAVGSTTLQNGGYGPVAWVSPDGQSWSRVDTREIGTTDKVRAIRAVVAKGDAVVALADPGKGDTTSVILRSPDGGRTWLRTAAALPGVRPEPGALAVAEKGFLLVPTLQKSTAGDVRVYCSDLGDAWRQCGVIDGLGREATGVRGLASSSAGVAAVAEAGWERYAVFTSADGKNWTESTDLGQIPGTLRGLAITDKGTLVAAGDQRAGGLDNLAVLMTAAKGKAAAPVPLADISGLTRSARDTTALVAAGDSFVAVGSVKGDAGIWTSPAGQNWKPVDSSALGGAGRQSLNDVAHGPRGWLAVGSTTADSAFVKPLLVASTDGRSWRPPPDSPALNAAGRYAVVPRVVAAGPEGYVLAGDDSGPGGVVAALWFTADLRRYARAAPQGLPAGGADVRIEDITATPEGYLAVGGSGTAGRTSGVVWVSRDGLKWTAHKRVIPEGARSAALRRVSVRDDEVVAVGTALTDKGVEQPFAAVSGDEGVTWQYSWLPAGAPATVLDMTSSASGLVAVGSYGAPATGDSTVWTSEDGREWQRHALTGDGMTGDGAQWLGAIAVVDDRVVAVGRSTTYTSDHLTLWRTTFSR